MINLNGDIDLSRFFTWWGQELKFLLPKKMRESFSGGKGFLVVEASGDKVKVSYVKQEQEEVLGEFEHNALAKEEIQNIIDSSTKYKEADIVLRVPENLSVKQDIFLPAAAEANIQQALTYEIDKYTPFNKDQVYFDTIKLEKENKSTQIHLLLILVKKSTLDEMYQRSLDLGLVPYFSDSAAQTVVSGDLHSKYNLLPSNLCQKRDKTPFFIMLGSLFLTCALLAFLLFYPLYKLEGGLDKVKHHRRLVEKEAMIIDESKKGIDYLYLATQKVIDKQNELPPMIDIINTASRVLKDDTWVSQFRFVNKSLQITGQSGSASSLIESLEKTTIFHNAKFISPVTKDNRSGKERFKISTEIVNKQRDAEAE
ncbi:MAG: PilN domain-containing protein [Methylococcales bacterium]|nr:PilN domain-containing protein [Methylococcales bacterium]